MPGEDTGDDTRDHTYGLHRRDLDMTGAGTRRTRATRLAGARGHGAADPAHAAGSGASAGRGRTRNDDIPTSDATSGPHPRRPPGSEPLTPSRLPSTRREARAGRGRRLKPGLACA